MMTPAGQSTLYSPRFVGECGNFKSYIIEKISEAGMKTLVMHFFFM